MAIEVSSQATKVALQYSVIGAIISAVALPSALLTASKLIDDPYQIVVIRADEAGKELAKCLLLSDERRPGMFSMLCKTHSVAVDSSKHTFLFSHPCRIQLWCTRHIFLPP